VPILRSSMGNYSEIGGEYVRNKQRGQHRESVMVSWERSEMDAGISKTYTEMCFPKSEFGKERMK